MSIVKEIADKQREWNRARSQAMESVRLHLQAPMQTSRLRNRVWKVFIGKKVLLFRRGNFSGRKIVPFLERGPFRCWTLSWRWGQLGWELRRWR